MSCSGTVIDYINTRHDRFNFFKFTTIKIVKFYIFWNIGWLTDWLTD